MPDLRTDAQLVAAYLSGDRSALAGVYDRFGAGLYDTAAAMLRDRHEAADATQDVFLMAAEKLGQLRDPERLKPWLYAILRNEVYRRSRKRGRALPTDFSAMGVPEVAAPTAPDADAEGLAASELGELVRSAACGLDERDQLVLELSVRQGLQGAELAAALGVTAEQSYTLVHRMRDRVNRSLGALVVARAGRKDCPELAGILRGWDGEFTVLIRKRVARHVESCDTCERTRKKAAPLALLGAAPAFAAPPELRDTILDLAGRPGAAPRAHYRFDADGGFPRLLRAWRYPVVLAAIVAVLLVGIGGGAILAGTSSDHSALVGPDTTEPGGAPPIDTTVETVPPATTDPNTTTSTTSTTSTTTSTTTPPNPGQITLSSTVLDLGTSTRSATVQLTNTGGQPVSWNITGTASPYTVAPSTGTLQPGESAVVTIALRRTALAEGDVVRVLTVTDSNGVSQPLTLQSSVEHAPVLVLDGPTGEFWDCQWSPFPMVYVNITDESAVATPVLLAWSGPQSGTNELALTQPYFAEGELLVRTPTVGVYTYSATVTDARGNSATIGDTFTINACPG